jgi:hypothetical protein
MVTWGTHAEPSTAISMSGTRRWLERSSTRLQRSILINQRTMVHILPTTLGRLCAVSFEALRPLLHPCMAWVDALIPVISLSSCGLLYHIFMQIRPWACDCIAEFPPPSIILGCTCSQIVVEYQFDDDFIEEEVQKKRPAADIPTNEIRGEFQVIYTGTCPFIAS